jgi:hypothetical protein
MLQNYNKILTKLSVFSITLEWNPDQDLHEKQTAYFTHPDFSAAKVEKKCANYASKYGSLFPKTTASTHFNCLGYIRKYADSGTRTN